MDANSRGRMPEFQEHWILQGTLAGRRRQRGWSRWRRMVSAVGAVDDTTVPPPAPETIGKVAELVAQKYRDRPQVLVTTASDPLSFQPLAFLESGTQQGNAVCRIVREFTLNDFKRFIKDIQASDDISHFDSIQKLTEVFSIPQDIADDLFTPATLKIALLEAIKKQQLTLDQKQQSLELANLKTVLDRIATQLKDSDRPINFDSVPKLRQLLQQELRQLNSSLSQAELIRQTASVAVDLFKGTVIARLCSDALDDQALAMINPIPLGTGFLVGERYLMTNNHVLPDIQTAAQCIAQFNYTDDATQNTPRTIDFHLDPQSSFITNPDLDYTLVQIKQILQERQAGYQFGWVSLVEKDDHVTPGLIWVTPQNQVDVDTQKHLNILQLIQWHLGPDWILEPGCRALGKRAIALQYPRGKTRIDITTDPQFVKLRNALNAEQYDLISLPGDPVFIVQHPKGRQKEIVLRDNEVANNGLFETVLRYRADSDYGSSGSPVFNANWELVALHHAAIASAETDQVSYQQGIRIHAIIADLKRQQFSNPILKGFLDKYVVTAEQLNYPPLPSGLEFDGLSSYAYASIATETPSEAIDSGTPLLATASRDGTLKIWSQTGSELTSLRVPASPLLNLIGFSHGSIQFTAGNQGLYGTLQLNRHQPQFDALMTLRDFFQAPLLGLDPSSITHLELVGTIASYDQVWLMMTVEQSGKQAITRATAIFHDFGYVLDGQGERNKEAHPEFVLPKTITQLIFQKVNLDITAIAIHLDNTNLAIADARGIIELYSLSPASSFPPIQLEAHRSAVKALCFSPTDWFLVSGDEEGRILGWRKESAYSSDWSIAAIFETDSVAVSSLVFAPYQDGNSLFVISGQVSGVLKLWRLQTQPSNTEAPPLINAVHLLATYESQQGAIHSLKFHKVNPYSNEGPELLAAASEDGTVNLWQWDASKESLSLLTALNHGSYPTDIVFNANITPPSNLAFPFAEDEAFTIEAWVNPHPNGTGGAIISKLQRDQGEIQGEYILYLSQEGHLVFSILPNDSSKPAIECRTKNTLPPGDFSHIAVVYSPPSSAGPVRPGKITLFINGQELENTTWDTAKRRISPNTPLLFGAFLGKTEVTETTAFTANETSDNETPNNTPNIQIPLLNKDQVAFFKGVLAEVRLWKTARSPEAIQQTMHRRLNPRHNRNKDLVGYWRFEEGQGNRIYNLASSASERTYGMTAGTQWVSNALSGLPLPFGMVFDGMDDQVVVDKVQKFPGDSTTMTVEAWVKHQGGDGVVVQSGGRWRQKNGGIWEKGGFALACYQGRLRLDLQPYGENARPEQLARRVTFDTQTRFSQDGLWHHIAFTLEPSILENASPQQGNAPSDTKVYEVEIYLDGKRQNIIPVRGRAISLLVGGVYRSRGLLDSALESPIQTLTIGGAGANAEPTPWNMHFRGAIAEVRLWNKAKTQNEIRNEMHYRLVGNELNLVGYWRLDELVEWVPSNAEAHTTNSAVMISNAPLTNHGRISGSRFFPSPTAFPVDTLGHEAAEFIQEMVDKRLMDAFWSRDAATSDLFRPNKSVSEAEFIQVVNRTFGISLKPIGKPFKRVQAISQLVQGLNLQADRLNWATIDSFLQDMFNDAGRITDAKDRQAVAIATANRLIVNLPSSQSQTTHEDSLPITSQSSLRPQDDLTRAELAILISRALVAIGQARDTHPPSVVEPHWAAPFILNLKNYLKNEQIHDRFFNGIHTFDSPVLGSDYKVLAEAAFPNKSLFSGRFDGQKALTRMEAIAALTTDLGLTTSHEEGQTFALTNVYRDTHNIQDEANKALLKTATNLRLVVNYPDVKNLRPQERITKAEFAALVYQALLALNRQGNRSHPFTSSHPPLKPVASPFIVEPPGTKRFSDIPPGHWAEKFIRTLADKGFKGFADGTFKPDLKVNATEFASITAQCLSSIGSTNTASVGLTPSGTVSLDEEKKAIVSTAILNAYAMVSTARLSKEPASPNRFVKRQEAIYHLINRLELTGEPFNLQAVYQDSEQITNDRFKRAIATATTHQLIVNYPNPQTLAPTEDISRAELAALLYQSLVATEQAPQISSPYVVTPPQFTDMEGHWAKDRIFYLANQNIVKGFPDRTFRPDTFMSRAEFASVLAHTFDLPPKPNLNNVTFSDVPADFWAWSSIRQVYAKGLMVGLPENKFGPQMGITRLHAAIILVKCLMQQTTLNGVDRRVLQQFTDIRDLNSTVLDGIAIAIQFNIISRPSTPTRFRPNDAATRAEVAVMVAGALLSQSQSVG